MLLLKQNHGQGTVPCQPKIEAFCAGGVVMSGETLTATARRVGIAAISLSLLLIPSVVFAQSPWERAASNLERTFTGPLARSLALVAIVLGGLMFMFGEAGAKRQISGIVFGGGLALFAAQFLTWLF
jgi:type IV secretory pathway VirB2 component (pilin)